MEASVPLLLSIITVVRNDAPGLSRTVESRGFALVDPLRGDGLDERFATQILRILSLDEVAWQAEGSGALASHNRLARGRLRHL